MFVGLNNENLTVDKKKRLKADGLDTPPEEKTLGEQE